MANFIRLDNVFINLDNVCDAHFLNGEVEITYTGGNSESYGGEYAKGLQKY
jgi:hypothetical protein